MYYPKTDKAAFRSIQLVEMMKKKLNEYQQEMLGHHRPASGLIMSLKYADQLFTELKTVLDKP